MRSIARKLYYRYVGEPPPPENPKLRLNDRIIHTGKRSYAEVIDLRGQTLVKKTFTTSRIGKPCFAMEKRANTLFAHYPWMTTWLGHGRNWFLMPRYPEDAKLANLAKNLPKERRQELAGEALSIALDIFVEGYAHRDFHAGNLFLIDDGLKLVDFEWMTPYPDGWKGTFWQSHDVTGECLERFKPDYAMGFTMDSPHAISNVLGVTLDEAKEQLGEILKKELHEASTTFKTHKRDRHVCSAGLTYSAFSLPHLTVDARSAQRNCSRRFEQFGVGEAELGGKTLLDLGSNIGGMLFEAQKFKPSQCLGVEVDSDKVAVARRVAAFAELVNLSFMQADIDRLSRRALGTTYDVTFCLAIDRHVKKPERLYWLLGQVTKNLLLFEGNAGSSPQQIEKNLREVGFRKIENLGFCDDDCVPENNQRPIFRAWK